ncbi:TPA: hypothetical protein DCL30_03905 [Candidatus Peribacteria bacterium]|nr:MAG: hypothetical protein A2529_00600 [Candidatus Peribacteria bacterium RIFOXYD2_FULL_58_15]HAI98649.1 hypothetical protein [Candidatus Peribacteria bacterium]HAS34362.1 hypothetical protein [Candidatus Peribacteria bacterium]
MYSGKCVDYGWTTDNEDCTIGQLEPESPKFIPCAPGLAQCCMTAGGYSGKISPCTNPGATYEAKCEAVCEPVHGPCIERPGGNGAICSAAYSNGGDSGVDALFVAQRHNDIAAAELAAAQEAANDAKDALDEAKDAYVEAKSEKTEAKQEASAAKSALKGADSGEKADAMAEMLTAQSAYTEAAQAVADSKTAYAAAKNTYTKVKAAVSNAKRTFKKEAAELKAAKKAAQ